MDERFRHYTMGLAAVDAEHWDLLRCLQHLGHCLTIEEAESTIASFLQAWDSHHAKEERAMADLVYPWAHFHIEQHAKLGLEFGKLRDKARRSARFDASMKTLAEDTVELLLAHIDHADRQFSEWFAQSQSLGSLAPS